VIGLPGETVEIKDNKVYILASADSQPKLLTEGYLAPDTKTCMYSQNETDQDFKVVLKDNEFFVMGDNREHSSDSREWGVLPRANIVGRVWITVTPLDRLKIWSRSSY